MKITGLVKNATALTKVQARGTPPLSWKALV
jgi:hypothetical protein